MGDPSLAGRVRARNSCLPCQHRIAVVRWHPCTPGSDHRRTVPQRPRRARRRDGADDLPHRLFRRAEEHHGLQRSAVRRAGPAGGAGAVAARASLLHPGRAAGGAAPFRRRHRRGRHPDQQRPVRRRHAPAGHLHLQAAVRRERRRNGRSPMPRRSATTPMSAAACPVPTPPTAPRSTPRACASRR